MLNVEFRDPKVRSELPTVNCSETIRNYDFVEISDALVTLDGVVQQLNPSATHPSTISINYCFDLKSNSIGLDSMRIFQLDGLFLFGFYFVLFW